MIWRFFDSDDEVSQCGQPITSELLGIRELSRYVSKETGTVPGCRAAVGQWNFSYGVISQTVPQQGPPPNAMP